MFPAGSSTQPLNPPAPQSPPRRNNDEALIYRFPFGAHKGKTLREAPVRCLAYLRVDKYMAASLLDFDAALRLFDSETKILQDAPVAPRCDHNEASLYRFPFGTHRGKTLLEVPENYIAYLRVDEHMASSMPGLAAALDLFDAGLAPVAASPTLKSPSSSQMSAQGAPPSSAPARLSAPQYKADIALSPAPQADSAPAPYRFDFSIHTGKTLAEVPADYIKFLKERGIVEGKPALAVAVIKHEREEALKVQSQPSPAATGPYTLNFGRHMGKMLDEVPAQYLTWLRTSECMDERPDLRDAMRKHDRATATPKPLKRKRSSVIRGDHARTNAMSSSKRRRAMPKRVVPW